MIFAVIIGTLGSVGMLAGLKLLLSRSSEGTLPNRAPAAGLLVLSLLLIGVGMWGGKHPAELDKLVRPRELSCPQLLGPRELFALAGEQATAYSGRPVEAGWCEYDFEFRSGRKLEGRVDREPEARQDEWLKTCGNHPLTQSAAEVWARPLPEGKQLVCFLTARFEGAIWLEKDDDGLKWVRALQASLPGVQ